MYKTPNIHHQTPSTNNIVTRNSTEGTKASRHETHQEEIEPPWSSTKEGSIKIIDIITRSTNTTAFCATPKEQKSRWPYDKLLRKT
jgi:hypothetical protein